jgi:hypothetical protein
MGRKLTQTFWQSWLFVFIYSLTPLSSSALFTAAAIAKVKALRTIPPFFCGKFLCDALMIVTAKYAAGNLRDVVHGTFSSKGILAIVLGLVVVAVFLFFSLIGARCYKENDSPSISKSGSNLQASVEFPQGIHGE